MHRSLNKSLNIEEPEAVPPLRNTDAQLRAFALEAESNGDYILASNYYKTVNRFDVRGTFRRSSWVFSRLAFGAKFG